MATIYTDGGCNNITGLGAWAYIVFMGDNTEIDPDYALYGSAVGTTNNRMEMIAAIRGITSLNKGDEVTLISDSGYLVTGATHPSYLAKWRENGWRTSKKQPVENQDLWEQIIELMEDYKINWVHVRGHGKNKCPIHNKNNDICDRLCTKAMKIRLDSMEVRYNDMD